MTDNSQTPTRAGLASPTIGMAFARLLIFIVPLFVLMVPSDVLLQAQLRQPSAWLAAMQVVFCVLMIIVYRIGVRLLECRSASELFIDASTSLVLLGILLGTALIALVFAIQWVAGAASIAGFRGLDGLAGIFGVSMTAAIGEEIIARGVIYRILENAFGTLVALIVSSAVFGLLHGANPGASLFTSAAIGIEAGLVLGLAYSATRSLWFPIGVHFGWNFAQGAIFGAISGFQFKGILNVRINGPEILTGGSFGPEASIIAVIVCLVGAFVLGWAAYRAGRWCPLKTKTRQARP